MSQEGRAEESVIDQRGERGRPGDPPVHNRSSIVATASPGAAQEKGGGGEVGRIEFHNMCEEHLPHDMLSSASVSLPLEKSFAACIEYGLRKIRLMFLPRGVYAVLPLKRLLIYVFDYLAVYPHFNFELFHKAIQIPG